VLHLDTLQKQQQTYYKKYWRTDMNWITSRLAERTTWDGGVMITMGLIALFATSFIKIAAVGAIIYGAWTIWQKEDAE
jgi:hypothetical protein|tara:strand:- start:7710 stop:7943 length:234 start_codon:yes stop_codon:yes gene_type:complete